MIDPLELKARADEILDAMPPDGRPNGERTGEAIRIALGDLRAERYWSENGAGPDGPFALPINEFIADKRDAPEPLIGTEDDCILPAKGLGLLIAKGGKGKTTFAIELALHLASGVDYLGLPIRHPINILPIENEGPQEPFRRKLARKLENWPHEIRGHISIYTENWGHARLDLAEFVERLNTYCDANQIDLVIGDPLDSLGMEGEGSPSETRAMVDRFRDAGLFSKRAWLEPHHSRKDSVEDAVDAASGAWGGRPDAMLALEKKSHNQARLSFAKVRWQARERQPFLLDFDPETESFTFIKEEAEGEERDYAVEVEELLAGKPPKTISEIVAGIGAGKAKVEEALQTHPDRFDMLTGEAAKAAGRNPNAKLYTLRPGLDSTPSPESPDSPFQGVA
jgi:AAA domain